ncbi:GL27135 [Drosophila persimilis]|uniref:GL27135 n=1 Tax=Drosophila persimilis TaxID=7234 RepID=B4GZE1_DROPE|nr:GL27135 [Drosophila persimilis]
MSTMRPTAASDLRVSVSHQPGPKVRRRHQFKVRACPQRTKDKLLSMPKAEEDDSPEEFQHE